MASRRSINSRAKGVERELQQRLDPGSIFAGGAKRPALEDEDLRIALDEEGNREAWGEVKNWSWQIIQQNGGPWAVLDKAYNQVLAAIDRNVHNWPPGGRPFPFAVLWPKGSRTDSARLCMLKVNELVCVVTLEQLCQIIKSA